MNGVTSSVATELISQLVAVESVTPWLVTGGAGESAVANQMAHWLSDLPVLVELDEISPGRVNMVATLKGNGSGPTLCINAHSDTVGYAGWPDDALVPRLDGDRLYGLGAADDKGCCAAALLTLRELATAPVSLQGDLMVACVADEEGASIGTEHLLKSLDADAAIVLEPDRLPNVVVEHQGFGWLDVNFHGRAAHGSAPDEGIDAIVGLAMALTELHHWDIDHFRTYADSANGKTVFHTGTVRGGTDYATYPSECTLGIEIGTQPGETMGQRVAEINQILDQTCTRLPGLTAEVVTRLDREPFRARGHEPLLERLQAAASRHLGAPMTPVGMNAWTDAALMQAAGIPTILMGPLGGNFHAPNEWVSISEVVTTVELLTTTVSSFLR